MRFISYRHFKYYNHKFPPSGSLNAKRNQLHTVCVGPDFFPSLLCRIDSNPWQFMLQSVDIGCEYLKALAKMDLPVAKLHRFTHKKSHFHFGSLTLIIKLPLLFGSFATLNCMILWCKCLPPIHCSCGQ